MSMSIKAKRAIILWGGLASILSVNLYMTRLRRIRQNELLRAHQGIQNFYDNEPEQVGELISQADNEKIIFLNRIKHILTFLWILNLFCVEISNIHLSGHTVVSYILNYVSDLLSKRGRTTIAKFLLTLSLWWNRIWSSEVVSTAIRDKALGLQPDGVSDSLKRLSLLHAKQQNTASFLTTSKELAQRNYQMKKVRFRDRLSNLKKWFSG